MRKHKVVTIAAEGRDKGKSFLIVEKSAFETEKWAARALLALGRAGVEVSDEVAASGALGLLMMGLEGLKKLPFEEAEPLLDEMTKCISFVIDASRQDPVTGCPVARALARGDDFNDGDIEELGTLLTLRGEALELHLGFSVTAVLSSLATAVSASSQQPTPTSRKPAEPSSPKAEEA